jgi:hypothetical protein
MVRGLVDEHVTLTGEQPRQRAGHELVTTFAQQIARATANDEVELELVVAMGARGAVAGGVARDASPDADAEAEILDHRTKR